jgi:type VI secretion system protein ImpG
MTDDLLPYYNRELAYIRRLGSEFAATHPKIAGRLRMSEDTIEDPHVSRLIEAFAYLNARTRRKIDDDFPEITESLLGILYPHYLAPIPSASIIRFALNRSEIESFSGETIPRRAQVDSDPIDGQPCRFQTCYPVTVWPIKLTSASYHGHPLPAPLTSFTRNSVAVLRIDLECLGSEIPIANMEFESLRFFLNGSAQYIHDLYESLFNNVEGIALAASENGADPVLLGAECIQQVGFDRDQGLLDYSPNSFLGYRLLTEYFVCPEKFLFLDIKGLTKQARQRVGDQSRMSIFIYLNRHTPDLERFVDAETFMLGCTPMINLYSQRTEPIQLTHYQTEYRIVPDVRRPQAHEIYSVDRVIAISPTNEEVEYLPFYSTKHRPDADGQRRYWHATRRDAGQAGGEIDHGTEMFLTLVDLDFEPDAPADWAVVVETTCLNRDLPSRLPFGGGQPNLTLTAGGQIERVTCVTPPTKTRRPPMREGTIWRLISHLSLNHLSLADNENGAEPLREILSLYDFTGTPESRDVVAGLLNVQSRRTVGRVNSPVSAGFCRGVEVTLHFDEDKFTGSGLFLFASVLERFLGLYSSINSFTKTIATTNRRELPLHEWSPRAGERVLL